MTNKTFARSIIKDNDEIVNMRKITYFEKQDEEQFRIVFILGGYDDIVLWKYENEEELKQDYNYLIENFVAKGIRNETL